MMISITKNKYFIRGVKALLVIGFCLGLWEICAVIVNSPYLLPRVSATLKALIEIVSKSSSYSIVLTTIFRVLTGLALGVSSGVVLATVCHFLPWINLFVSPILSIIKATPVASFIVLLMVSALSGHGIAIMIAFLMVLPIVWQNIMDAYATLPKKLIEVSEIYNVSLKKRIKFLYLPHLYSFLAPAFITSIGLAWKSEIAAEIIVYTTNSIGQQINDYKQFADETSTAFIFAWTFIIIVLSIVLESLTKYLLKRCKK